MSLRNKLALLFALLAAGAVGVVYVSVVPQLDGRLRDQKLDTLARQAERLARPLERGIGTREPQSSIDRRLQEAADSTSTRVTLLAIPSGTPQAPPSVLADTVATTSERDALDFRVAEEAARTERPATGTEPTGSGRVGLAAEPLRYRGRVARVLVLSDSLEDEQANVELIRSRVLASGALALGLALLAGFLVARAVTARVRRLEQAARQVADGEFSARIEIGADDELGQLALAFDEMQDRLARLDRARSRFIATASHELRTPIFSLGGFLELLEDEDLDEETRATFLAQVRDQVDRLGKLTTELLDLSRMESGAIELRPEPTEVGQLAHEVAGEFRPAAAARGSALAVHEPDGPVEADFDPERAAQVLRILLDNALLHTPQGTAVAVTAGRGDGEVRFEVADEGPGIPPDALPHVFEPFYKGSDNQGAGLGLAIAYDLAERMDGRLEVATAPGRTAFTFHLPGNRSGALPSRRGRGDPGLGRG